MKKIYVVPEIFVAEIENATLLAGSGVSSNSYVDTEYGGVDDSGSKDPAARLFDFVEEPTTNNEFEDEEEDDYEDF